MLAREEGEPAARRQRALRLPARGGAPVVEQRVEAAHLQTTLDVLGPKPQPLTLEDLTAAAEQDPSLKLPFLDQLIPALSVGDFPEKELLTSSSWRMSDLAGAASIVANWGMETSIAVDLLPFQARGAGSSTTASPENFLW